MRLRAFLICAALLLASVPYLSGWLNPRPDGTYTGIRSINASDYNQNLSFIDQIRKGHFFLQNKFTSLPHPAFLVRPVYYILTSPFGAAPISNSILFHFLRVLTGLALCITVFILIDVFTGKPGQVNLAFAILALTSGLGWCLNRWIPSTDLSVPESILFVALGEAPHFLYSLGFLWTGMTFLYLTIQTRRPLFLTLYFACLLVLWWEHPFEAVTLTVLGCIFIVQFNDLKTQALFLLGVIAVAFPAYLYYRKLITIPAFSGWGSQQNLMTSPSVVSVLAGYLPQILLSIAGFWKFRNDSHSRPVLKFLTLWILVQLVLMYVPFPFQRRLMAGIQFPLALLAALGLQSIPRLQLRIALIVFMMFTNVFVIYRESISILHGGMPYYLPDSYARAFQWLENRKDHGAVFSEFVTGNFIPAYTGHPSFMGHSSFTPDIAEKRGVARQFFRNPDISVLKENNIRYVFWGLEESKNSRPVQAAGLNPIYRDKGITIFDSEPSN